MGMGPRVFIGGLPDLRASSNSSLLLELCVEANLIVSNAMFDLPVEEKVTFYDMLTRPTDDITPNRFAELDLILVPRELQQIMGAVRSFRNVPIRTHHFLVCGVLHIEVDKPVSHKPGFKRRN